MQLHRGATLPGCEELHTSITASRCASEAFAFVTRWIPARNDRPPSAPRAPDPSHRARWVTGQPVWPPSRRFDGGAGGGEARVGRRGTPTVGIANDVATAACRATAMTSHPRSGLDAVQLGIDSIALEQLFVGALFHEPCSKPLTTSKHDHVGN